MADAPSIFISYSTHDEAIGRAVRNMFEDRGHDALLLKLHQHMTDDFIMDLVRNEVKARDWVVMVDTQYAQQSNWVAFERAIAGIYHKPLYHVDGDCAGSDRTAPALQYCLRAQVAHISRQLRIFMSYSHKDEAVARRIFEALAPQGYQAFNAQVDMRAGEDWSNQLRTEIEDIMERGVFIVLVSASGSESRWVQAELDLALSRMAQGNGRIIPCLIEPVTLPKSLSGFQYVSLYPDLDRGLQTLLATLQHFDR